MCGNKLHHELPKHLLQFSRSCNRKCFLHCSGSLTVECRKMRRADFWSDAALGQLSRSNCIKSGLIRDVKKNYGALSGPKESRKNCRRGIFTKSENQFALHDRVQHSKVYRHMCKELGERREYPCRVCSEQYQNPTTNLKQTQENLYPVNLSNPFELRKK